MGYWVDTSDPYRTMDPEYVESVWWALKQIYDKGLLVEDYRVAPYCPRCGTGLSDHELAQGYETVVDPSVYVRFPLTSGPYAGQAVLLVWTTTPWTLVSNTAVAVHPDVDLRRRHRRRGDAGRRRAAVRRRCSARAGPSRTPCRARRWSAGPTSGRSTSWTSRRERAPPRTSSSSPTTSPPRTAPGWCTSPPRSARTTWRSAAPTACRSSTRSSPTALRRRRPAGRRPVLQARRRRPGQRPRVARPAVPARALRAQLPALLALPHAAASTTPSRPGTSAPPQIKDALLRENEKTNWFPETIKWGRYGDWLHNNVDWALSRSRYWGTPLPIWRCDEGHLTCVGSLAELAELTGTDQSELDPHRPFVDDVTFACPDVRRARPRRVPEVIDAWYDSGSMPFAQWGYPHVAGLGERCFEAAYPAQFICEAIDQTRGWFYTLMAVGTLVFDAVVVRERGVPRATSWPRTAARCPSTSATSSSRSR